MACNNCEPCETLYSHEGCPDNIPSGCVPYNGAVLACLNIGPSDNVNTIIKKLVTAVCDLSDRIDQLSPSCANLSNIVATKTGSTTASVSFLTNNSSATFKYSLDGGDVVDITSNPFTISGLSTSVHNITISVYNSNSVVCGTDDGIIDMTTAPQITVYWTAQVSNTLPTESELLAWPNNADYTSGGTLTADYVPYNTAPKYLLFAEPFTEPAKTVYYFSSDDNGFIGSSGPWADGVHIGAFRVYITNYPTQTADLPLQFKVS
jgi:hypothetical protein